MSGPQITQADREAAAKWAKMQARHAQAANMLRGSCDTAPLVQAFARHREASQAELVEALEELVAAMRRYEGDVDADADVPPAHRDMMRRATAIIAKARGDA